MEVGKSSSLTCMTATRSRKQAWQESKLHLVKFKMLIYYLMVDGQTSEQPPEYVEMTSLQNLAQQNDAAAKK